MTFAIISMVLAISWVPLLFKFLRGWRERKNPVSMAICACISFLLYSNVTQALILLGRGNWKTVQALTIVFNVLMVANFYLAFYISNKKFPPLHKHKK